MKPRKKSSSSGRRHKSGAQENDSPVRLPEIDAHLEQVDTMSKTLAKRYRQKKTKAASEEEEKEKGSAAKEKEEE